MVLIRFLIYFYITMGEMLISQSLTEIFNKNISIEKELVEAKEFFDNLSKETGINFIYSPKKESKILVDKYKNKPLKILLRNLENEIGFKFLLKFEKEDVYILVEDSGFFEKTSQVSGLDLLEADLKDAPVKDFFLTIENYAGKKFIIKDEKILAKKITIKCKKKWEDLLEDASKMLNFKYKIEESTVVVK